jgi:hypothetical protein
VICELDIEGNQRYVVADTDLDVRPEMQAVDQRGRFTMRAEIELIGIRRCTCADADFLRGGGKGVQSCNGEYDGNDELSESKHAQM